jgi:ParB family transcriptional regulator, chromosome partitioning protein
MKEYEQDVVHLIPLESIHVLNPRVRNTKIFDGIVHNMTQVGIKRPITVTPRRGKQTDGKLYDLVCGQGRLEAFHHR